MDCLKELNGFCEDLCKQSGAIIQKYFRAKIAIDNKKDASPVTKADRETETLIRELIQKEYPEHGIIGEEFAPHNENAEYKWILDPIDGTVSFISGAMSFGTLIALTKNDEPLLGVYYHPILKQFLISDGKVAKLNGENVKMRVVDSMAEATLLTTDIMLIKQHHSLERFNQLSQKVRYVRGWGDCYGYYLLATGFADIMVDPIMNIWDIMALVPIIRAAGGVITDYHGDDPVKGNSLIAAAPNLHEEVIKTLN